MLRNLFLRLAGASDYDWLKRQNVQLHNQAHYDDLTGLANRLMFNTHAPTVLEHSKATSEPVTFFLVDLDNFKMINDSHGHQAGNSVLIEVGRRLTSIVHARCQLATDIGKYENKNAHTCGCCTARLGGDEFVVIFEHMDRHEAEVIGAQMNQVLKELVFVNGVGISVSASIGVSICPWDGNAVHDLLKAADLAMYSVKEHGKDRHQFFEKSMNTKIERRVEAEAAVREMISNNHVTLYYQPIIRVETGEITSAEALIRGRKPKGGFFNPEELIRAAEDANLIGQLGIIILRDACEVARQGLDIAGHGEFSAISVNVSAQQLTDPNFADIVLEILAETNLPPENLIIEITETMLIRNFKESSKTLELLGQHGIRISIDDFGKGYSSFNYLQRLPIHKIKIDMSFTQMLGTNIKSNEIVKGIILMADILGLVSCAEGVETELQYAKLKEYGCDKIQGYYLYKPLEKSQFLHTLSGS